MEFNSKSKWFLANCQVKNIGKNEFGFFGIKFVMFNIK